MTKIKNCLILCFIASSLLNVLFAEELKYIKNLGQWNSNINYKVNLQGGQLYLEDNVFTYIFYDSQLLHDIHELEHEEGESFHPDEHLVNAYAFQVELLNANTSPTVTSSNKLEEYHNL